VTEVENILHRMTHPSWMMDCNDDKCHCSDCISSCLHGADFFEKLIVAQVVKKLSFLWKLKVYFYAKNDLILDSLS
jgi:hypothetical protein